MRTSSLATYRCPETGAALTLDPGAQTDGDTVVTGRLSGGARPYEIVDRLPNFAPDETLKGTAKFARDYYATIADTYDENVHITFDLYGEEEQDIRTRMIDLLDLKPDARVLEVSAGTGKDSVLISERLGDRAETWLIDISPEMLGQARDRLAGNRVPAELAVGNASALPFADNSFDALYCFAGVGHFPDQRAGLAEMARVVRPGGRVVFAEKNVPPWLADTTYGRILVNNNPMFADPAPLALIPVSARDVGIRWINGNVHYVVDYMVGDGEPVGNFDLDLPGHRGGSFNTRFYGKLEGVTPETKEMFHKAAAASGKSLHNWLDEVVRDAAKHDLGPPDGRKGGSEE
ncbi:MAG: methyltransferase domain-containing protein [Alphaproteobacteria bacterium]|nr:methyltransferase domain-containing protein [Alphaproteobacteria bacterium]